MQNVQDGDVERGDTRRHAPGANAAASAAQALTAVVEQYQRDLRGAMSNPSVELTRAIDAATAHARGSVVRCEQLVIILKSVWYSDAGVRQQPDNATARERLDRLVTLVIGSYYRRGAIRDD